MATSSKRKTSLDDEALDKLIANLQIGIPAVESAKDGYLAHNKSSSNPELQALGKYQFVPKYWWGEIETFAKKNGYELDSYEDFLNSPSLQDSYFRHYVKNDILPQAEAAYATGKNPDDLSLEEMAVFFHFQSPKVAKKAIFGGEEAYREATKKGVNGATVDNISMKKYRDKYVSALDKARKTVLKKKETLDNRSKEQIFKDYDTALSKIIHGTPDLSETERNIRIQELQSDYKSDGNIEIINEMIEKKNVENQKSSSEKTEASKEELNQLIEYAQEADFTFTKDGKSNSLKSGSINLGSHEKAEKFKNLAKKNGIKVSGGTNFIYNVDSKSLIKTIGSKYQNLTGEKFDKKEMTDFDGSNFSNKVAGLFDWFGAKNNKTGNVIFDPKFGKKISEATGYVEIPTLDPSLIPDRPKVKKSESKELKPHAVGDAIAESEANKGSDNAEGESGEETTNAADAYLDRQNGILGALDKDGMSYNKKDYKQDLPIDAVTGLALGLIGNDQAKNAEIPLRSEDIGQAVKAYTSELARRSKEGLPPEVMAAIDNKLAEAYQGGLESIKNTAGGNSALILGNQGTLENAKNKGLVNAQLANYEAKEKAFQQYGEAIQYIDQVRMNRDIANTTMRQRQGLQERADGQQLAAAGFAKMIDGIKYQKENGPGSANHMYKSGLMQKMFGFDPAMKDDGTGKPGTRSAFLAKKAEFSKASEGNKILTDEFRSFDKQTRSALSKLWEENPTEANLRRLVDEQKVKREQPQQELAEVDPYATQAATTEADLLTPEPTSALAITPQKPVTQNKGQVGGINTGLGFIPNTILGTEPTAVAPTVDIAAQAMAPKQEFKSEASGLAGQIPSFKTPEMPIFNEPKTDLASALATSVQNQSNYYNNQ